MERIGPHPAQEHLERFMRGELARDEAAGLVRHLLTGCPRCVGVIRRLWRLGDPLRALKILRQEMLALETRPGRPRASLY